MYTCTVLCCSMAGGELFDRIQRKGHFTERGKMPFIHVQCTCTCMYTVCTMYIVHVRAYVAVYSMCCVCILYTVHCVCSTFAILSQVLQKLCVPLVWPWPISTL